MGGFSGSLITYCTKKGKRNNAIKLFCPQTENLCQKDSHAEFFQITVDQ